MRTLRERQGSLKWILPVFILILLACAASPGNTVKSEKTVIVLSMDGMRWDYPRRDHLEAFARMAEKGLKAGRMTPPFPSLTFPSHSTIATGCYPNKHGIVANSFLDVKKHKRFTQSGSTASDLREPPLWVIAEKAGIRSAVAAWPCSKGEWRGTSPTFFRPFGAPGWDTGTLRWILDQLKKPSSRRPGLIMAWTSGADHPGHLQGPDGAKVIEAERRADHLLAGLEKGIEALPAGEKVDLIVLSDHGMAAVNRVVDVVSLIPKHAFFPYIAVSGPICNIYAKNPAQRDTVARALKRLPPDVKVYEKGSLPPELHYLNDARTGDFVIICPLGSTFLGYPGRSGRRKAPPKGMHGYLPEIGEMGGIFYAEGPDFRVGSRPKEVRAVDVAPTVCKILGIQPPPEMDGTALKSLR